MWIMWQFCYNPVGEDMALCAYVMLNKDKDTEFIKSQCKKIFTQIYGTFLLVYCRKNTIHN